jgi:hypothetical protein
MCKQHKKILFDTYKVFGMLLCKAQYKIIPIVGIFLTLKG